ncbi:MAG: oxaloacetate decarboxylase [Chloroflexi bacterium]|nr:oxaloacetate decarboxylase [Chloroflexota bacterium]
MKNAQHLRQLLREGPVVAPGAYDAITARAIQEAGYPAVYLSGSGLSCARGKPDVGWMSLAEVVEAVKGVVDTLDVPVIADADTGYGGVLTVRRTVKEFEAVGAAALHMEDQVTPKRCAYFGGVQLISSEEMVAKVRAAVGARQDPDFMIIARTDALQVSGLDDAIERGRRYMAAGADGLFLNAIAKLDDMERLRRELPDALLLFNMNATGNQECRTVDQAAELGYRITILPGLSRLAVLRTLREQMAELKKTGTYAGFTDRMETFAEFNRFMGLPQFQELERRYYVEEPARSI